MRIITGIHEGVLLPRRLPHRRRKAIWALVWLLYGGLMIVVGAELYKNDFFSSSIMPYVRGTWQWPVNKIKSTTAQPKRLVIDMKWDAYQKLSYQREQALQTRVLLAQSEDFVPAKITADGRTTDVKMRLKGDNVDHLRGEKWSFRVAAKGDQAVLGMKQFSLHHPRARNWLFEWFGQRLMRREGIIGLRYDFVDVVLNGKALGIYALEEHFEKRLVENNERREGPIVRYSEDMMWREITRISRPFPGAQTSGAGDYLASEPDGFGTKSALADPAAHALYLKAVHLLDLFRRGDLPTTKVFDSRKLATYFALVDLLGGEHGSRWHNIRFYYNPVSSLLEPIAFDLNAGRLTTGLSIFSRNPPTEAGPFPPRYEAFQRAVFADEDFCREYLTVLQSFAKPEYLDHVLKDLAPEQEQALAILYKEFPYYEFSPQVLYKNQQYIQTMLRPSKGVHAFLLSAEPDRIVLQVGNTQYLPLTIVGLEVGGNVVKGRSPSRVLPPRRLDRPVEYEELSFQVSQPTGTAPPEPALLYKVVGTDDVCRLPVSPHALRWDDFLTKDFLRRPPNPERFTFLSVDEPNRTIVIQPGRWEIKEPMIVPPGYTLRCGPGTELDLRETALLLSRSPVLFHGTEDNPIVIRSGDGTGQGLVVLRAGLPSELERVRFEELTNADREGWVLTGAVTFYESPVSVLDCHFSRNHAEDALNVIRSDFTIARCTFSDTTSDAFDADFSDGTVRDSTFLRCTNDGVDVSGSVVHIENVSVEQSGDKAVSSGEASRVTIAKLNVAHTRIGMASKDSSELEARLVTLTDCRYGLAAYQKKSEFGAATLRIHQLAAQGVDEPYLVEEGSVVSVDDRVIPPNRRGVMNFLYGNTQANAAPGH